MAGAQDTLRRAIQIVGRQRPNQGRLPVLRPRPLACQCRFAARCLHGTALEHPAPWRMGRSLAGRGLAAVALACRWASYCCPRRAASRHRRARHASRSRSASRRRGEGARRRATADPGSRPRLRFPRVFVAPASSSSSWDCRRSISRCRRSPASVLQPVAAAPASSASRLAGRDVACALTTSAVPPRSSASRCRRRSRTSSAGLGSARSHARRGLDRRARTAAASGDRLAVTRLTRGGDTPSPRARARLRRVLNLSRPTGAHRASRRSRRIAEAPGGSAGPSSRPFPASPRRQFPPPDRSSANRRPGRALMRYWITDFERDVDHQRGTNAPLVCEQAGGIDTVPYLRPRGRRRRPAERRQARRVALLRAVELRAARRPGARRRSTCVLRVHRRRDHRPPGPGDPSSWSGGGVAVRVPWAADHRRGDGRPR